MWSLCFITRWQNKGSNLSEGMVMVSSRMEDRRFVRKFQQVLMSHPPAYPPAPVDGLLNWSPFPFCHVASSSKLTGPFWEQERLRKSRKVAKLKRHSDMRPLLWSTHTHTHAFTHIDTDSHTHMHKQTQTCMHTYTNRHRHTDTHMHTRHTRQSLSKRRPSLEELPVSCTGATKNEVLVIHHTHWRRLFREAAASESPKQGLAECSLF